MQAPQANLFTRDDTLTGVCEALGRDLGFNPLWLRIALGAMLIWQPVAVICAYLAAGVVVLASRLAFPAPREALQVSIAPAALPQPGESAPEATSDGAEEEYEPLLAAA